MRIRMDRRPVKAERPTAPDRKEHPHGCPPDVPASEKARRLLSRMTAIPGLDLRDRAG